MLEISDHLEDVVKAIDDLAGEVKVLREVVDEIRESFEWILQNPEKWPQLHVPDDKPV